MQVRVWIRVGLGKSSRFTTFAESFERVGVCVGSVRVLFAWGKVRPHVSHVNSRLLTVHEVIFVWVFIFEQWGLAPIGVFS